MTGASTLRRAEGGERNAAEAGVPAEQALAALTHLLKVEAEARLAATVGELAHLMANETRVLTRARQVFVLRKAVRAQAMQALAASSLTTVDRQSPVIGWVEGLVARLAAREGLAALREFSLPDHADPADPTTGAFPFRNLLWVPLWDPGSAVRAGLLLARETPWSEPDRRIAARLAGAFGHALVCLEGGRPRRRFRLAGRRWWLAVAVALLGLGMLPVPITALAPLEVAPRDPHVVAMPVDGIVQKVLAEPNATVGAGEPLVQLNETVARHKLEIAKREVAVAEARLEKVSSLAFSDAKGRHELGIARAELALRMAERDFAAEMLSKLSIAAAAPGLVIYGDRRDLEGRPFAAGDRLLQVATPGAIELRIDLPVAESIVLEPGARIKAFLDSDPLAPVEATIAHIDFQARLSEAHVASYRVVGRIAGNGGAVPRLGTRGTAQLYGPRAPLALAVLRRPLAALRQKVGL